jgi:signal transduction histidine kinase
LIGEDGRVQWAAEGPTAAADAAPAVIPATIAWTAEPAHEANAPHAALSPLAESAVAGDPEGTQAGRTTLYLPLRVSDRMIGMLTLDRTDPHHAYLPEEVAHADYFARRAAVAIDNARLHQRLRDADRRKDEFLAMLAHELRNPLGSLRNASHLLRLASTDPDRVQWCQALVERQVVYLSRLAEDLLDVSRITRGQLRLDCERIDLRDVAGRAVETTGPFLKERRHQLTTNLPDEPVFLEADATRLEQVLVNLLINAGRYTDPGGQITVVVERHEQGVVVRVRDNGVGIDGDALPRIFDLFMQADAASRHARSGLGLGLSLVRSLVEMHGGQVSAHSAGPGQGSEFMVYLPLGSPSE